MIGSMSGRLDEGNGVIVMRHALGTSNLPSPRVRAGVVLGALLVVVLLYGCATVPEDLTPIPEAQPDVAQVRADPEAAVGTRVVWGGVVATIANRADATHLEIVARPLGRDQRPRPGEPSPGRFRAVYPDFLDPEVYTRGREVTVRGVVVGVVEGMIDEYTYTFPEVEAEVVHLWPPPPREPQVIYRDPFWDPWWPHYRQPWGPHYGFPGRPWPYF